MKPYLLSIFIFATAFNAFSQQILEEMIYSPIFDKIIGLTNSGIYNGIEYIDLLPEKNNKHKFFNTAQFKKGSVMYNQYPFYDLQLKYDVYNDELLVINSNNYPFIITQLFKDDISTFRIGDHTFVNTTLLFSKNKKITGFFEIVFSNKNCVVYKKHLKKIYKKTEDIVYYEFKDYYNIYLKYHDQIYRIKKVSDLITVFPEKESKIKELIDTKELQDNNDIIILTNYILNNIIDS